MLALSARPPRPRPAHRPALLAALMIAVGVACLALANQTRPPLVIGGALAMSRGVLLISPLAIRALAALGGRAPVAVRLALRDLARHQARSGAALAAISLALGITAAIILSSAADKSAASAGNLPDTQILVWIGQPGGGYGADGPVVPVRTPAELVVLGRRRAPDRRTAASLSGDRPRHARSTQPTKPQSGGQGSQRRTAGSFALGAHSRLRPPAAGPGPTARSPSTSRRQRCSATSGSARPRSPRPPISSPSTRDSWWSPRPPPLRPSPTCSRSRPPSYASQPTSLITPGGLRRAALDADTVGLARPDLASH